MSRVPKGGRTSVIFPDEALPVRGTARQLADALDITERTVYNLQARGILPVYPRGEVNIGLCVLLYRLHKQESLTFRDPESGAIVSIGDQSGLSASGGKPRKLGVVYAPESAEARANGQRSVYDPNWRPSV